MTNLGDVVVVPTGTENPYKAESLCGPKRSELLGKFFAGEETPGWEFWIAPVCGGAKKVATAAEANVDPDVIAYYWSP
jgi:hypothetical protein